MPAKQPKPSAKARQVWQSYYGPLPMSVAAALPPCPLQGGRRTPASFREHMTQKEICTSISPSVCLFCQHPAKSRVFQRLRVHTGAFDFQSSFGPARKLPVCTKRVCERLLLSAFRNSAFMCKSLPRLRPKLVGNRRRHRRLFRRRRGPSGLLLLRRGQRGMYRRLLHGRNSKNNSESSSKFDFSESGRPVVRPRARCLVKAARVAAAAEAAKMAAVVNP